MESLSSRWQTLIARPTRPRSRPGEAPLRSDLLTLEQLARHAKGLAGEHKTVTRRGANRLLARLDENEEILRTFNLATVAVEQTRQITPAAEWLLDNFYLIEEQIRLAKRHLPKTGSCRGSRVAPRRGCFACTTLHLTGYQTVASVTLGELCDSNTEQRCWLQARPQP